MLIDTHAHLYWDSFKPDFDEVIKRSLDASVTTIINVGVDIESSKKALRQAQDFGGELSRTGKLSDIPGLKVYSTIGIHPHEAINYSLPGQKYDDRCKNVNEDITQLEKIYRENPKKVIAVGECGLDYYFRETEIATLKQVQDFDGELSRTGKLSHNHEKELQRRLFQAQIDLAKKLDLPLIVHCRDDRSKNPENCEAWDETLNLIGDYPAIFHCYSGLTRTTHQILKMSNVLVSFGGRLTYPKNEYLREAVKILPLDKICLETDCPFLPLQSKRGQRNEPSAVLEIARLIAELKGITLEEVANQTTNNVKVIGNPSPLF